MAGMEFVGELEANKMERNNLETEVAILKKRLRRLEAFISYPFSPFHFTLENFSHFKRYNLKWFSSHFFSHPLGYSLYVEVDANGQSVGEETHVSLLFPFYSAFPSRLRGGYVLQVPFTRQAEVLHFCSIDHPLLS